MSLVRLNAGFHGGAGSNALNGWGTWWQKQHTAGIPVNAIFADNAGPLWEIQQSNFIGDVLVYRRSLWHNGFDPNSPNYAKNPEEEAVRMLSYKYDNLFPTELDKLRVWLKDTNEIRTQTNPGDIWYQNLSAGEWWGRYGLAAAKYALGRDYKVILLSPSSGDHSRTFWTQPSMLDFLGYAAANKENIIIGLHEYSYVSNNLFALPGNDDATIDELLQSDTESRRVGRFELLFNILDEYRIDWPLLYLCEWGWSERNMPDTDEAMNQIITIFTRLYGKYRHYIMGWGTWYLGPGFGDSLPIKTNSLLQPCANHTVSYEYDIPQRLPLGEQDMCNCDAISDVRTVSVWIPQYEKMTADEIAQAYSWARYGFEDNNNVKTSGNHMLCPSHVDALRIHTEGLPGSILAVAYPEKIGSGVTEAWIRAYCPCAYEDDKQVVFLPKQSEDCTECLPINLVYSQRDVRWANDVLGQNTGHTATIGNYGCLLTAYNIQAFFMGLCSDTPRQFNTRMTAAGAFTQQYLNAGALATTFPNSVQYNGYLNRGDALNARIKAYIDMGYSVPVQVDFKPATSQWEQHWVLVIGYNATDFYVADPWVGDKIWLSTRYNISGNDIVQGVFYTKKTQPVARSKFGLHLRADPSNISAAEYNEQQLLQNSGGNTVKLLHNHPDTVFQKVGAMRPKTAVVRIMQSWGGRNITPEEFYNWNADELVKKVNILKGYNVEPIVEVHNEPNLVQEGWTLSWGNGYDFGIWLQRTIALFKQRQELASLKFIYPGLSPGSSIPGVRYDSTLFLNDGLNVKNFVNGFGCHAYWSQGWPMSTAIQHVNNTKAQTGMPVWVTESSINDRPSVISAAEYGKQYAQFIKTISVEGLYFFVGSASNSYFAPECWVSESGVAKGIATALSQNL